MNAFSTHQSILNFLISNKIRLRHVVFLLLFFCSLIVNAQTKKSKDTLATILIIGYTTRDQQIAAEIAPKFGFRYVALSTKFVDGVIIYPDTDSISKHNAESYKQITRFNGIKWQEKFNVEVNRVKKNYDALESFFEENTVFFKMREEISSNPAEDNHYGFDVSRERKLNRLFIVNYHFYIKENGKMVRTHSILLKVNLAKQRVRVL